MPTITINGHDHTVPDGQTLLHALRHAGIDVPTLCHDDRLKPIGGCRLCLVRLAGHDKPVTACNTPVVERMVVETHTPELEDERRALLTWIAQHYPPVAVTAYPDKPFHRLLQRYGVTARGEIADATHAPFVDRTHPHLRVDMQRCVLCYRCVHICAEVQGQFVACARAQTARISCPAARCRCCRATARVAGVRGRPSGAIEIFTEDEPAALHWTRTVCPYCSTGCDGAGHARRRVVATRPVLDAPVNRVICA